MVSAITAAEGVTIGFFTVLFVLLVCGIAVGLKFRRRSKGTEDGYRRISTDSHEHIKSAHMGQKKLFKTTSVLPQPTMSPSVTWADPLTQCEQPLTKPRSISCPPQYQTTTPDEGGKKDGTTEGKGAKTLRERTRKRSNRRTRAKTDGCNHVCQVQFSILYNFYNSKLFVKLVCAVNIPSTFGVTYGSYIKVELLPSCERAATDIQFHTNNPVFDETVEFPGIGYDDLLNKSLKVRLFTMDRFSHSSLVGQVVAPFAELEINPARPTIVWRPIFQNDGHFHHAHSSSKEFMDRGDLFLSLRYQIVSNKVTVVVMKAVNLPHVNKIFAVDPYVIVKLLLNLETVQTKTTTRKRRTTSPCWNEPFVFEIDEKIPISEYSLCFIVKSHNSLSEDLTLGELEIGYHAGGLGREHWKDMVIRKNQDRAMCHKLK